MVDKIADGVDDDDTLQPGSAEPPVAARRRRATARAVATGRPDDRTSLPGGEPDGSSARGVRPAPRAEAPIGNGENDAGEFDGAMRYACEIDIDDDNDAHALVVRLVGRGKRVLELGPATGSTTKVLGGLDCDVVGIEIDSEAARSAARYAERIVVGDLDLLDLTTELGEDRFDVVIAADVLEHLRDPRRCLLQCVELLRPNGEIILSIPNVAHADIRLALLQGNFRYQSWGLLDETHLRFFTGASLSELIAECELIPLTWWRTRRDVGSTEIEWDGVDDRVLSWVKGQPDADTYQFVVRCAPAPRGSHLHEMATALRSAEAEITRLRALEGELESLRSAVAAVTEERDDARVQLATETGRLRADYAGQIEQLHVQLAAEIEQLHMQLAAERERLSAEHERTTGALVEARQRVAALEDTERQLEALEAIAGRNGSDVLAAREGLQRAHAEMRALLDRLDVASRERDDYKQGFEALSNVHEELVALRRSESFRLGQAMLSPMATLRRLVRAWRRAGPR